MANQRPSHALSSPRRNPLHEEIERQARYIETLRSRLVESYEQLGITIEQVTARPLDPQHTHEYSQPDGAFDARPHMEYWPSPIPTGQALAPLPGQSSYGLRGQKLRHIGYSVCGLSLAQAEKVIAMVAKQQGKDRDFLPLFLTDSNDLSSFRRCGYSVEYLPSPEKCAGVVGTIDTVSYHNKRLAEIREKWDLAHIVQFGPAPLAKIEPAWREKHQIQVIFHKDYSHLNPYQKLLYSHLAGIKASPGTILDAQSLIGKGEHTVFHLNWEESIYAHTASEGEAQEKAAVFLQQVREFVSQGGSLVWSVHNLRPHDDRHPNVHRDLCTQLGDLAHVIHVHSTSPIRRLCERYDLPSHKFRAIPHGNYAPLYSERPTMAKAKQSLRLPYDAKCFLIFGNIRAYKGVDRLIRSFSTLENEACWLVIAGRQHEPVDLSALSPDVRQRVICIDQVIPENEIPSLFAAADFAAFPFHEILSSGSVMLALTLGTPIIVPRLDSLLELVEDDSAIFFNPDDEAGLSNAMFRASRLPAAALTKMQDGAISTAKRYDWRWIGRRMTQTFLAAHRATKPRLS